MINFRQLSLFFIYISISIVFALAKPATAPCNPIGFQIHSWNDLREWPSACMFVIPCLNCSLYFFKKNVNKRI